MCKHHAIFLRVSRGTSLEMMLVRAKPTASGRATQRASERCVVRSSRNGIDSFFQEGPAGQEGGAYARLAKPVPCAVGAQVPLGDYTEPPRGSTGANPRERTERGHSDVNAPNGGYLT